MPPEIPEGLLVAMGAKRPRSARKLSLSLLGRAATPIAEAMTRLRREPSILEEKTALLGHNLGGSRHGERGADKASYMRPRRLEALIASLDDDIFLLLKWVPQSPSFIAESRSDLGATPAVMGCCACCTLICFSAVLDIVMCGRVWSSENKKHWGRDHTALE